jgi:hypothetical protein
MAVLWVVAPCILVEVYRRSRGACCPYDGSKHFWNVNELLPVHTAQQPRRRPSSYSPPWQTQNVTSAVYTHAWHYTICNTAVTRKSHRTFSNLNTWA